ncbi:MAG: DUF2974 domain-containing protein [Bacilli bacterium]|nr:DUF2974 domain-containing protein [Bacilli bacterium]
MRIKKKTTLTIEEYVKMYQDKSLSDAPINEVDYLLFALLTYLPLKPFVNPKTMTKLKPFIDKEDKCIGKIAKRAYQIFTIMEHSKRFGHIIVSDYVLKRDNQCQFKAMTFHFGKEKIIAYEGTDGSFIGWLENIRLLFQYPNYTQELAISYLENHVKEEDQDVVVLGHSKGGNLALAAGMEVKDDIYQHIKGVYNFDGPGFRKEQYESDGYQRLLEKLHNYYPEESLIGMLLANSNTNTKIVKSYGREIDQHRIYNWKVEEDHFRLGSLKANHEQLKKNIYQLSKDIDKEKTKKAIEALFGALMNSPLHNLHDISLKKSADIMVIISNLKDLDKENKRLVLDFFKKLYKYASYNPKKEKKKGQIKI